MPPAFFAYGSLIFPEVLRAVTGLDLEPVPALLPGYARYLVRDESYPGIIPSLGSVTNGALYAGVHRKALERLDRFEGDYYERIPVKVGLGTGSTVDADTYVFRTRHRHLLTAQPWDREIFRARHLDRFLTDYGGFLWADAREDTA